MTNIVKASHHVESMSSSLMNAETGSVEGQSETGRSESLVSDKLIGLAEESELRFTLLKEDLPSQNPRHSLNEIEKTEEFPKL